ncbi:glycine zipper 2TM domain-containing protein [Undibacterium sp. Jales W-56]|uniref:glycine zipper 2TM domain-containing protein n=1 Tax=Undibacterium sp. Jales W-56 TaxID=2897325 RepID=UPI0021D09AAF|nr:glycine zipper 2TM domain-containing protein [Undibacterium sp. Jales W-56]MCU6433851.1 glycine zipper 2TM domain-containing protein [Undibacterium sp. Jales W-56]
MKSTSVVRIFIFATPLLAISLLTGCASNAPNNVPNYAQQNSNTYSTPYQNNASNYGVIDAIQVIRPANNTSGGGAIVGGLIGGLLGNQVGNGNGRTAATVAGAVGGAMVGNSVEQNKNVRTSDQFQIQVRLDNGSYTTIVQDNIYDLRVGDRIRLINGQVNRY